MAKNYDDIGGVWRTVGGRHIFIKDGKDLATAMKESGKFNKKENYNKQSMIEAQSKIEKEFKNEGYLDEDEYYKRIAEEYAKIENRSLQDQDIKEQIRNIKNDLSNNNSYNKLINKINGESEYSLYKRAREDEGSIDPMTENSTDWEALDKKYRDRYEKEQSGYKTYLKDTQGTNNEELINAGREKENRVDYQKYKNETIRTINKYRMEKGTTSLNQAYKKAFEEYKRLHPNTKLNLQEFIKMSEE